MNHPRTLVLLTVPLLMLPSLEAADGKKKGLFAKLFGSRPSNSQTHHRAHSSPNRNRKPLFHRLRTSNSTRNRTYSRPSSSGKVNWALLHASSRHSNRLVVDVSRQRAYLLNSSGSILITTPISSARPGKHTPRGSFRMYDRVRSGKVSTIYGVSMPFWMRLSNTVYGVHAGYLPGYPASAGCVRLPYDMAKLIYENTTYGTRVNIYSSWSRS